MLHLDVMDGHFVPNLTMGPALVQSVRKVTPLKLDVHLMITDPDRYAPAFIEAGADCVSVHQEVCITWTAPCAPFARRWRRRVWF